MLSLSDSLSKLRNNILLLQFTRGNSKGLTLIELVIAMALMAILASAVIPMAEMSVKRSKELELRRSLRIIRTALDHYHDDYLKAVDEKKIFAILGESGYPEDLEVLLEGDDWGGLYPYRKKYLRRIPRDPFDVYGDGWGKRSYSDEPDSKIWSGKDVYDVYSQSDATALNGTLYCDW